MSRMCSPIPIIFNCMTDLIDGSVPMEVPQSINNTQPSQAINIRLLINSAYHSTQRST